MSIHTGLMLIDPLLLVLVVRAILYKRKLKTFRPDRKFKNTLPNTILTRVS